MIAQVVITRFPYLLFAYHPEVFTSGPVPFYTLDAISVVNLYTFWFLTSGLLF